MPLSVEILARAVAGKFVLAIATEVRFLAGILLVPTVFAPYHCVAGIEWAVAATGCGSIGAVIPVIVMLDTVDGQSAMGVCVRLALLVAVLIACGACRHEASPGEYLFALGW